MSKVYFILNETTFQGTDQVTVEVVSASLDLDRMLDEIQEIARDNEIYVDGDADSVTLPGAHGTSIESDEYYIAEEELK